VYTFAAQLRVNGAVVSEDSTRFTVGSGASATGILKVGTVDPNATEKKVFQPGEPIDFLASIGNGSGSTVQATTTFSAISASTGGTVLEGQVVGEVRREGALISGQTTLPANAPAGEYTFKARTTITSALGGPVAGSETQSVTEQTFLFRVQSTVDPSACVSRPSVSLQLSRDGAGGLQVRVIPGTSARLPVNQVTSIEFGAARNATITGTGMATHAGNVNVSIASPGTDYTFTVRRNNDAGSATVPIVINDRCGPWRTFVGGGPSAF
jgi:hypothetical protein